MAIITKLGAVQEEYCDPIDGCAVFDLKLDFRPKKSGTRKIMLLLSGIPDVKGVTKRRVTTFRLTFTQGLDQEAIGRTLLSAKNALVEFLNGISRPDASESFEGHTWDVSREQLSEREFPTRRAYTS